MAEPCKIDLWADASALAGAPSRWHGTLMLIGKQEMAVALHDTNTRPAGTVSIVSGPTLASSVKMELTTRSFSEQSRQIILDGIRRTAQGVAVSAGIPDNLAQNVADDQPIMASVDFGLPGLGQHQIPTVIFWLGARKSPAGPAYEQGATGLPAAGPGTAPASPVTSPSAVPVALLSAAGGAQSSVPGASRLPGGRGS